MHKNLSHILHRYHGLRESNRIMFCLVRGIAATCNKLLSFDKNNVFC
jgi:hypothetical protein